MRNIYALLAVGLLSSTAQADPPKLGHWVSDHPITICDSEAQIQEFVAASQAQGNGFQTVYEKYNPPGAPPILDKWGEPTCLVAPPGGSGEVITVRPPQTMWFGSIFATVATAELKASDTHTIWVLYNVGPVNDVKPSSMPPKGIDEDGRSYILFEPQKIPWLWMIGA